MGELLATLLYLLHVENWPGMLSSDASGGAESKPISDDSDDSSYVYVESFINIQDDTTYLDREKFLRLVPFTSGSGRYTE